MFDLGLNILNWVLFGKKENNPTIYSWLVSMTPRKIVINRKQATWTT